MKRRVTGEINRIHNKEERLKAARFVRDEVNALLKERWTIGQKETVKTLFKHLSIGEALEAAFEIKKSSIREGTWKDYVSLLKLFRGYLKKKGHVKDKIAQLTTPLVEGYLDELLLTRANKTRNNHLTNIRALLRLINRREKVWPEISGADIPRLATTTNKHTVLPDPSCRRADRPVQKSGRSICGCFASSCSTPWLGQPNYAY